MREYELIIDEALINGLSPLDMVPINSQYLQECMGFRLGKAGLEKYELKENPLPSTTDLLYSWPFPQFITGEGYNFLIVRDSVVNHEDIVYYISDDHETVTHIFSVDQLTFGQGGLMEVADFGEYAFLTNGVIMIYWDTALSTWQEITSSTTIPMMKTVCNFNGQAVGGNIVDTWHDCDETYYVWSKIGDMDFTPDEWNTAGYRRDPHGGEVYHVRKLGDAVIGYSSKGITLIKPVSEPVVSFGFAEIDDIGLINKGAVACSEKVHVYVGEDYRIKRLTNEGLEDLGYEHYISQLTNDDIIVNYDKKLKDFYISDGSKTFLLSPKGLTEIPQHPSALWRLNNETHMLPDTEDDYQMLITSQPFNMGFAGQKTIFSMETDLLVGDSPEVAVSYYNDITSYSTTPYVPLNNQNIASVIASGTHFAFNLRFEPTYDNTRLSYLKARYKMTDLRGIRGVYAPPPRGQ